MDAQAGYPVLAGARADAVTVGFQQTTLVVQ
jgi:hypothetical protein